jgi:hypothetical protein
VHTGEREGADDDGWRDLKVGVWFRTTSPPPSSPGSDWTMQAEAISYYCDIAEANKFGDLLWATGFQRQALQAQELIFLGDGADGIWNLVQEHYPEAVQIVDWFHAAEHLAKVAHSAFPEEPEARRHWLERHREALWAGRVEAVVQACEALREQAGDEARKGAEYFRHHASRMRYATFRAQGYQIGSGTIESACKQLGIQRMKVPGATWTREGARRTAKARAALLSDQWDLLAKRREYLPRVA